jgi:RNA polymerase sigma-70 factor (ECF subfamily)
VVSFHALRAMAGEERSRWRPVHKDVAKSEQAPDAPARQAQGARRAEFERLFAGARSKLWLIAAAITTDRAEADDIVQESAIVGLANFDQYQSGTSFEHWMGQIARNLSRNAARSGERRRRLQRATSRTEPTQGLHAGGHERVMSVWIQRGLAKLEEDARECLLLRTVGGHSYREIATITGLAEGTAMSHVHRSRQRLREMLSGTAREVGGIAGEQGQVASMGAMAVGARRSVASEGARGGVAE